MAGLMEKLAGRKDEDVMTGVLTRQAGTQKINRFIEKNPDMQCAFMIFDGDNFKKINDSYGHSCGDDVIIQNAKLLTEKFADKGIILRFGGDEFVVFYTNTDINEISSKLRELTMEENRAVMNDGKTVSFTFSVGVSMFPKYGKDFESLMKQADDALYTAKYEGRNCYRFNTEGMTMAHREQFMFDIEEFSRGMPGGFFVYEANEEERLLYASHSMAKLFHCDSISDFRAYVGNSFKGIVAPEDYERIQQIINKQQFETPQNIDKIDYCRYHIKCKDGVVKEVDDYGHLVHDRNYGLVYYVFLVDIHYLNTIKY
ncbi:MAG: GGDEF domain-containing protein [Lachnospiraceae bacterium]|nr:GGDEF domain-containing protein [Lachnospiraceae bacterium]